jgi:hypothetical protein
VRIAGKDVKFTVIGFVTHNDESYAIIDFWKFSTDDSGAVEPAEDESISSYITATANIKYVDYKSNEQYFAISLAELNNSCSLYYGKGAKLTYGVATLPYKVRFGDSKEKHFDFSSNFNFGGTVGIQINIPSRIEQSISLLCGLSLSAIDVDSSNTAGYQQSKISASALTPLFGGVYEYNRFQVGVFAGMDFISSELGRKWIYQGEPFLAVGIGVSLFQRGKLNESSDANKND